MKKYLAFFTVLVFFACNNSEKDTGIKNDKDSTVTKTQADEPVLGTPAFRVLPFDKNDKTLKDSIKGELVAGLSWQDADAEHRVLFTAIPVTMNKNDQKNGAVFAYCFFKNGDSWKKEWEVKDRIEACELDATCEFLPNSFTITDNDGNNFGEVTFLYKLGCRGDVAPDDKKLIMYEAGNKYAMRGTTILDISGGREGGEKKIDPSFTKAAKPLLDFANSQWDKFGITKY